MDASDGVALNGLEVSLLGDDSQANVDFHVEDSAAAIASVLATSGASLDGAEHLVVDSGDTTVQGAADIQSLSGIYDASSSAYTVSDTAGAVLSDMGTGAVIDEGVTEINVTGNVGAGAGVQLGQLEDVSLDLATGYSADINFNVSDDANAIAQALVTNGNGALNNAEDVDVDGGVVSDS